VLASALVRVVPSAPFIVVNSAAGAAQIPIWKYWIGTAIGIIPKIALVATLGSFALDKATLRQGVSGVSDFFTSRSAAELLVLAAIVPVWLILGFVVRRFYNRLSGADAEGAGSSVSSEAGSKPEGQ
ncbi:MAG: VTT domain-containing protein, partial [Pseudomonadota bacterium]